MKTQKLGEDSKRLEFRPKKEIWFFLKEKSFKENSSINLLLNDIVDKFIKQGEKK